MSGGFGARQMILVLVCGAVTAASCSLFVRACRLHSEVELRKVLELIVYFVFGSADSLHLLLVVVHLRGKSGLLLGKAIHESVVLVQQRVGLLGGGNSLSLEVSRLHASLQAQLLAGEHGQVAHLAEGLHEGEELHVLLGVLLILHLAQDRATLAISARQKSVHDGLDGGFVQAAVVGALDGVKAFVLVGEELGVVLAVVAVAHEAGHVVQDEGHNAIGRVLAGKGLNLVERGRVDPLHLLANSLVHFALDGAHSLALGLGSGHRLGQISQLLVKLRSQASLVGDTVLDGGNGLIDAIVLVTHGLEGSLALCLIFVEFGELKAVSKRVVSKKYLHQPRAPSGGRRREQR